MTKDQMIANLREELAQLRQVNDALQGMYCNTYAYNLRLALWIRDLRPPPMGPLSDEQEAP